MKRKIGMVIAGMLLVLGIFIALIPWIAQKKTKDTQANLQAEYTKIVEEKSQSGEVAEEPEPQKEMDYTVADFSDEEPEESEEPEKPKEPQVTNNQEVQNILDRQKILGKISCEKIDLEFVVVEGAKRDNIRAAIGHITGTAGMGGKGNCVLAGHRGGYYGKFFKNINLLENGDKVTLIDVYKREYIYEVYDQFVVEPTELWVCDKIEGEDTLTLLSCEDDGTRRIIVRCRMVQHDS